jgi:RNA polymerase sigma factor (sigma-70 family)
MLSRILGAIMTAHIVRSQGEPDGDLSARRLYAAAVAATLHRPGLIAYASSLVQSGSGDASTLQPEDLVEMALERLADGRANWDGSMDGLSSFVAGIMRNLARHASGDARKHVCLDDDCVAAKELVDPYERANRAYVVRDVRTALTVLPAQMRAISILYWLEDKTAPQIAIDLRIAEPTVREQLRRAKARLQNQLRRYAPNAMDPPAGIAARSALLQQRQ